MDRLVVLGGDVYHYTRFFFISDQDTLINMWNWQSGLSLFEGVIKIGHFFFCAHYEVQKYTSCASYQNFQWNRKLATCSGLNLQVAQYL
jgi:hypothetical protein